MISDDIQQDEHAKGLADIIFREKVDSLYKALPSSVFANIIIASVMAGVLWNLIDNKLLILWFLVIVSINIGRYVLYALYINEEKADLNIIFWDRAFYSLLVLIALCWSSVSIWLLPDNESIYHYFPALILIGISAGAVTTLSFSMKMISTYLILLLLPLFIVELNIGSYISNSVAGLTFVLALFSFSSARRINNTIIENITLHYESQKYTENLINSRNEAVEASSAKSKFISMISHELRTPLNAILGFSQLLKMSDEPELNNEQNDHVDGITDSGKHLLSLIEELLDMSKIEAQKLDVNIEDVSLTYVLLECVSLLKHLANDYNVEIINNVDTNDIHLVKSDSKRLKQILINIISNAIKYNIKDGQIIISVKNVAGNKVRVEIKDTGNGLTIEQQKSLFTPFQRFDNKREGIGLGLYITQNIIEKMSGHIGVESKEGKGSTFWFELPVAN